jgi:hypothetical protein
MKVFKTTTFQNFFYFCLQVKKLILLDPLAELFKALTVALLRGKQRALLAFRWKQNQLLKFSGFGNCDDNPTLTLLKSDSLIIQPLAYSLQPFATFC